METCEKYKILMMGLMDNELTPEEMSEVHAHLTRCQSCRDEYESLIETSSKINLISYIEPQDEIYAKLWKSPYSRLTRFTGWFLFIGGWTVLLLFGLIELLRNTNEPLLPRLATVAFIIGFVVLLLSVLRERFKKTKIDPYKEVIR